MLMIRKIRLAAESIDYRERIIETASIRDQIIGTVSSDLNVTFLCMTKKCNLLGNFLLEIISNRQVRIWSQ